MSKLVSLAEQKNAAGFMSAVEESISEKVVTALEACKVEVAKKFFAQVTEEGGVSPTVKKVWKKPSPAGKGRASAPKPEMFGKQK